jgi:hypothetical protein
MIFKKMLQISLPRLYRTRNIDTRPSDSFSLRVLHLYLFLSHLVVIYQMYLDRIIELLVYVATLVFSESGWFFYLNVMHIVLLIEIIQRIVKQKWDFSCVNNIIRQDNFERRTWTYIQKSGCTRMRARICVNKWTNI